jgi:PAS domain S-box-containing protein
VNDVSTESSTTADELATATLTIDGQNCVARWDASAERIFGLTSENALGRPLSAFFPKLDLHHRQPAAPDGEPVVAVETAAVPASGIQTPATVVICPSATSDSSHVTVIFRNYNDRTVTASRRLAAIVESSEDAIVSKDLNGIVRTWNRAAERIFGYTADEMIGTSIRRIIPADRQNEEDITLETIRQGGKLDHFETLRQRKTGELIPISLTISPIRSDNGEIIGVSKIARDISLLKMAERERLRLLEESVMIAETLSQVGAAVASDLDRASMVQAVTDAATDLTGADFGAFFYNVVNEAGESYMLYTIAGVPREAFSKFPMPRNTALFDPTFKGHGVVRSPDITKDPRYGQNPPHHGMPRGHLPVRSYLAVPVKSRRGGVLGGLFFGHAEVDRFTSQHERLAVGVASWASVALENARLYESVQEAGRLKDEFLASLSHELRTPLNAILGYARLVRSGVIGPDRLQKAVETIERNAGALPQIVEDVLDVSRIIAGKLRLNVQAVDFPDVVKSAIDAVIPAADAKGVRIEVVVDPHATPISGDPDRLQQVFWNLLSNAVKFTSRGGKVQVRLQRINSHLEVTVSDTGIGIARDLLPHVFDRFRQGDAGTTRERGGLGLGLAIAKQLVEMHGGTITAESAGENAGATFRVKLPVMIVHPTAETEPRVHPRATRVVSDVQGAELAGVRVLAVDDEKDALALVADVLHAAGAKVVTANSAAHALEALGVDVPEVIIADLGMPVMDGFTLIGRIREHADPRVRRLPAAALTAYARSDDRMKALRAGFNIHLAKPIEPAELIATIASLVWRSNRGD